MKLCKNCGEEFQPTGGASGRRTYCTNECRVLYWNKKFTELSSERHKSNPSAVMLRSAKHRAKKRGLPFDLTIEDVVIPELCPVFGIPLVCNAGTGHARQDSPSLDKIIPELGYTKGNTQVISNLANVMKHDATPEQLIQFAEWVLKTYKGDSE